MGKSIQESVAEAIVEKSKNVANIVVDKLAETEVSKRVEMVTKAIGKQEALEKDLGRPRVQDCGKCS